MDNRNGMREGQPTYEFSNRGTYLRFLIFVAIILVAYGILILAGRALFLLGSLPATFGYLVIVGLLFLLGYLSLGVRFPSSMEFFEDFVRVSDLRSRKPKDIYYSQISKVVTYAEDDRTGFTRKVAFRVVGETRQYEVPKPSPHISMLSQTTEAEDPFVIWFQKKVA